MIDHRILLYSGEYFYFSRPVDCSFNIVDIAHALSNICRFGGHCPKFYSVAEHSVYVSYLVPPEFAFEALLHDAAEAFIGDVTKPLKQLMPEYQALETQIELCIASHFNFSYPLDSSVKEADCQMLVTEQQQLFGNTDQWFGSMDQKPANLSLKCLSPEVAEILFLERYLELTATA